MEVKERFDSLYQNVELLKGPIAFSFTLFFCARRLAFALVIGQVHWTIVYQIFVLDLVSTLMLCYFVAIMPMMDGINNAIQIFNEIVVLLCIEGMFLFTSYVPDVRTRYQMGQKVLLLVAMNIIINFIVLIAILLKKIYKAMRTWFVKRYNRIATEKAIILRAIKAAEEMPVRSKFKQKVGLAPKDSQKLDDE